MSKADQIRRAILNQAILLAGISILIVFITDIIPQFLIPGLGTAILLMIALFLGTGLLKNLDLGLPF